MSHLFSESYVEENPVAAFLDLLRRILSRNFELQEDIAQLKTISIIGYLLTKVEPRFLDVNVLFSVQLLIEAAQGSHVWVDFLNDFYQHILFDFRIWIKADFTIRLGTYVVTNVAGFIVRSAGSSLFKREDFVTLTRFSVTVGFQFRNCAS